jgi:hypothetical protein
MTVEPRRNYTIFLEILPTQPLTHGQGNNGNEQEILRRPFMIQVFNPVTGQPEFRIEDIFLVSGASFRTKLRVQAVLNDAEMMQVPHGSYSKAKLRLLAKGGHLGGDGKAMNLEEVRRLCEMSPLLYLFGAMDDTLRLTGALKVDSVYPYCRELLQSGIIPNSENFQFWQGDPNDPTWPSFPNGAPSYVEGVAPVQYYKHDLGGSAVSKLLTSGDRNQIQDKQAAIAALQATGKKPDTDARREANESMPHAFQAIIPGFPMVAILRTDPITQMEFACLIAALAAWKQNGAHLGGAEAKGHGHCLVRIAGHFCSSAGQDATPDTALAAPSLSPDAALFEAYKANRAAHAEAFRKWVTE